MSEKKKFIIVWDAGYGEAADTIECSSLEEAEDAAYQSWKEEVESNASYKAIPYTDEDAENWGLS